MASAISPHSLPPPLPRPSPPMAAQATVLEQNAVRILIAAQRLKDLLLRGAPPSEIASPCMLLARSIDYALSMNDVPQIASQLPSLVKQVYQHRNDTSLQSAITVLMIAVKNACRFKWFFSGDNDELLKMANELLGSLCTGTSVTSVTSDKSNAMNIISKIIPRFYPQLKLGHLLLSFDAKIGYNILFSDFHIEKPPANGETIRLFVAQTDDLETSSCLLSPADVSFLVNGVGVKGRNNVSLYKGSQLPTDITKMLKRGTNIIQIAGIFRGNYIIAIAFMSKATNFPASNLQDYVQPAITALAPEDPEIIEGPSRISLSCPISLRRIEMPVKGYRCKHLQCFDYGNFLEINSRKPSWRCPLCDQPACFFDLRIDQNMVKVLQDVTVGAVDVVLSANGSFKVVSDHDLSPVHHLPNGIFSKQQHQGIGSGLIGSPDTLAMDLTMNEDERSNRKAYEIEDCKPFKAFPVSESFPELPLSQDENVRTQGDSHLLGGDNRTWSSSLGSSVPTTTLDIHRVGTLASLVPPSVLNPVITGVISPASGQEATASLSVNPQVSTFQITSQAGLVGEYFQIQPPQSGNSIINLETERQTIPRQVSRIPSAIQAPPQGTQACSAYQLTQPDLQNSCFNVSSNLTSVSYLTSPSTAAARDALSIQVLPTNAGVSSSSQRAYPYLMNSGSNITGCSPILSHQKVSPMTAVSGGDIEMRQVSSGLDDSMLQQLPSMSQNQDPGSQSSALQQGAELPTSVDVRTILSSHPRTTDAFNSRQQPRLNHPIILNHLNNNIRGRQNFAAGIPVNRLARQYAQLQAAQRAAQMARLPTVHPYASASGCTLSTVAANPQLTGVQQLQNTAGQPVSVSDRNWRPMGRMRGSLSGNEYNAALNHYLAHPSQLVAGRPSVSTPERLVGSNSNVQANTRNSGLGNYTGI